MSRAAVALMIMRAGLGWGLGEAPAPHAPEEFGAVASDALDDHAAIAQCLATYGEVNFGAGTYLVSRQIDASRIKGAKLRGRGRSETRIKLMNDCKPAVGQRSYAVILAEADDVEVRDLWVECNFKGQTTNGATLAALHVFGGTWVIDGVKATGFQVGTECAECFVIYAALRAGSGRDHVPGGVIRNCEVTDAAENARLTYPTHPIITCIFASGGGRVLEGAVVENNYVHDVSVTQQQRSELHAFGTGSVTGARVTGNLARDFYGAGYYRDTWPADGLVIASNRFENVRIGVYFNTAGTQFSHRNVLIERNQITLAGDRVAFDPAAPYNDQQSGFVVFGPGNMTNLTVRANTIKGTKFGSKGMPRGIWLWPKTAHYDAWSFENNVLDLPAQGLHRSGLFHYATNFDRQKVKWVGNRSGSGRPVVLNVINAKDGAIAFPVQ